MRINNVINNWQQPSYSFLYKIPAATLNAAKSAAVGYGMYASYGTPYNLICTESVVDTTGGAYSAVTGLFTAPADGFYHFEGSNVCNYYDSARVTGSYLQINNTPGQAYGINLADLGGTLQLFIFVSCNLYLNSGQTASLVYTKNGDYSYIRQACFGGYLIS